MKRILVAALLGITVSTASFGQGFIFFNNYVSTVFNQVKYLASGLPVTSPTVKVQLFWVLGTTADPNAVVNASATTFINPIFTFNGGGYYFHTNAVTLAGFVPDSGGTVTFMVRAWETAGPNGGATFDTSGIKGQSDLWQEVQAIGPSGNGIVGPDAAVRNFNAGPPVMFIGIPEPSMFALAGLGLGSLLVMIRRQR